MRFGVLRDTNGGELTVGEQEQKNRRGKFRMVSDIERLRLDPDDTQALMEEIRDEVADLLDDFNSDSRKVSDAGVADLSKGRQALVLILDPPAD